MVPRAAVAATPYAMFAEVAEGADGDFDVAKNLTVEGKAVVPTFHAQDMKLDGQVNVTDALTVDGNLTADGKINVPGIDLDAPVPVGTIVLFYGTNLPPSWALCDGSIANGIQTPDLRGRFVVGAGNSYAPGDTGGEEEVKLTVDQLPEHSHAYAASQGVVHEGSDDSWVEVTTPDWAPEASTSGTFGPNGETPDGGFGQPHNNLPPYIALDYIMRVE